MKKIGILGGTFDPPHMGHLIIASEVLVTLKLDEIWFIPTKIPPHKQAAATDASHRVNMLTLATQDNQKFKVITDEIERDGISYSIDTVNGLIDKMPQAAFYFIIGADMVEYLPKWHKIEELIEKVQFVGVKRLNYQLASAYSILEVNVPLIELSSTDIKQRIQSNQSVQYFLPKDVLLYIKEQQLYGSK